MNTNPYAIYVNCDGAMNYNSKNSGGVGFVIRFPDTIQFDDISASLGIYTGGNIERLEMEALIQAMKAVKKLFEKHKDTLRNIQQIIFITDRFGLSDTENTNAYKINAWRSNGWKNYEGKPIKNHELLDKLDKIRKKLSEQTYTRVNIEYRPRKQNKVADKLAKAGKTKGLINQSLATKGQKIGKRKFGGEEIIYGNLTVKDELHVRIFRKDPVLEEWEVWAEICEGQYKEKKLKIYVDNILASKLKRMNEFIIKIKAVFTHHIQIFRTIRHLKKESVKSCLNDL